MPTYLYRVRDTAGKLVKGHMDAVSEAELAGKLQKMGYVVTKITEGHVGIKMEGLAELADRFKRIRTEDKIMFNIQLANMIDSGIPLLSSLKTLKDQIENNKLKEILGDIYRSIDGGSSFSEAIAKHPKIFSKLFVSMVKAGEVSGSLPTVLNRGAVFAEHQADIRQRINGALFYPLILIITAIGVTTFIVTFVMPNFIRIFKGAGVALPLPTMILYGIGLGVKKYWWIILLGIIFIGFGIKIYIGTERGRLQFDRLKLNFPIIGSLARKLYISRFARTLATMIASGVPILQSLNLAGEVVGNEVIARVIKSTRDGVEEGEAIAESLKISGEFPADMIQMVAVGEETGNLEGLLNKISDFYDMAVDYSIRKLTALLEPVFLLIIGCIVAFIMASMLLPIFDMMKALQH